MGMANRKRLNRSAGVSMAEIIRITTKAWRRYFFQMVRFHQSRFGEKECQDGNFEHGAHGNGERGECGNVGRQGNLVLHKFADRGRYLKTEGEGENGVIIQQESAEKQDESGEDGPGGISSFVFIQGRLDEAEKLIDDIGRSDDQPRIKCYTHVGH